MTIFKGVQRGHIWALGLTYFVLNIVLMFAFQLRWTADTAIYGSFWEAGKHLDYEVHPFVWITREGFAELNLNPPALLPLFQLFPLVDPQIGQSIWLFLSAAVCLGSIWVIQKQATPLQLLWLLTVPIIFQGLGLGQIYALMFALGAGIWWCLRNNKTVTAAVLVGILAAMKPNFALWGLMAFAAGYFRPAVIAGAVAFGLSLLPAILYGPDIYHQWLAATALDNHGAFPHDVSLWGYFMRLGLPGALVVVGIVFVAVHLWALRVKPTIYDLTPVAFVAAMLCSPLAWLDYALVFAPFVVDRPWKLHMLLAAVLFYLAPFAAAAVGSSLIVVALASVICLAPILIFALELLRRGTASRANSSAAAPQLPPTLAPTAAWQR